MSNNHARLVRALVFACFFPISAIAFAGGAKTSAAGDAVAQNVVRVPPQAAVTPRTSSAPIRVR